IPGPAGGTDLMRPRMGKLRMISWSHFCFWLWLWLWSVIEYSGLAAVDRNLLVTPVTGYASALRLIHSPDRPHAPHGVFGGRSQFPGRVAREPREGATA